MVVRVPPGPEFQIIRLMHHKGRLAERRGLQREIRPLRKLLRRGAQRRHGNTALCRLLRGGIQLLVPQAQQGTLPLLKIFRRHILFLPWDV